MEPNIPKEIVMTEKRWMTIHFNDSSEMKFIFKLNAADTWATTEAFYADFERIRIRNPLLIKEVAAAVSDEAGYGQLLVKDEAPNELWFTDDAWSDVRLGGIRYIQAVVFDFETTNTTGNGKFYIHIPPELGGLNLAYVHAEVITAGTTGVETIQIYNQTQTVDMLTTRITIDTGETGSDTAATPPVIDAANDDVATNDVIRIDVDGLHTTPAKGLVVTLGFGP